MQRTPAWFKARQGKLTASNFGAAAGVNPYETRNANLKKQAGQTVFTGNSATRHGTKNEPNAIKDYQMYTGNVVRSFGFKVHEDYPWLGGSPDGLVGTEGMIEVKCPFYKMVPHEKIPPHYYCQVNGLLEIFDRKWCDFVSWTPDDMQIYRVYRDPHVWDHLLSKYTTFYAAMKRGCTQVPRQQTGEKQETFDAISASDENTNYTFWSKVRGKTEWEMPFECPFRDESSDGEDQDDGAMFNCAAASSKRQRFDTGSDSSTSSESASVV